MAHGGRVAPYDPGTMRLLALSWTPAWPPRGGAAVRLFGLLSRFRRLDVRLVAPGPLPPGFSGTALPPRGRRTSYNNDILQAVSPAFHAAARAGPADVVFAHGIWALGAALLSARGRPVVLDLAHVETDTARESRPGDPRLPVLERIERWATTRPHTVWVVSPEDRERLVALRGSGPPIDVVPNGVDAVEPLPPPPTSDPRALFVGRMSFRPNLEAALFLAREVAPRWTRGRVVIAGEAPPRDLIGVEVVDSPDDVVPLYERAFAALAPVFSGSGVRNKALEAARLGRPLVATRRAVEGLGFLPGVHYVAADTGAEFAAALDRLLDAPGSGVVARAAEVVSREFLWDDIAARAEERLLALAAG